MARARAATSLSFTIGIAVATLVAATGILAGPSILDCTDRPQSFGTCLRGKVVASGLLPAEPAAAVSSTEAPLRAPGWIEANATEYDAPATGIAQLSAEPGRLDAFGRLPSAEVGAEIALVDPGATIKADGLVPLPGSSAGAELAPGVTGSIDASAARTLSAAVSGDASIEPPVLPAPPAVAGHVGVTARGQGRASLAPQLIADLSPAPPLAEIVIPPVPKMPPPVILRPPAIPKVTAQAGPKLAPKPRAPKYDPRFPNVLVLPPPNTGENSSFATLEVH